MIMIVFVETFREVLIPLYIHKCKSVEAVEFLSIVILEGKKYFWKNRAFKIINKGQ